MLKVKLLEKVGRKGKIRIRFEDSPHPGLEEYVGTRQIVVRWADRKAFLRDQEREQWLAAHCATVNDRALSEAANAVHSIGRTECLGIWRLSLHAGGRTAANR